LSDAVSCSEGDHIKVTASKYPFPTVCADKQSTDWFHAISRTLKWNERERQKSFVVVEEGPAKSTRKPALVNVSKVPAQDFLKEHPVEYQENGEDDEEEKFDIDTVVTTDSPSESATKATARVEHKDAQHAAAAIMRNNSLAESYSHSSSGIDSPDRFAGPVPHPHPISPRHVPRASVSGYSTPLSSPDEPRIEWESGDRDDIHSPRAARESSKSKIPRNRDLDGESARTPRAHEHVHSSLTRKIHTQAHAGPTYHHHHTHGHPPLPRSQRGARHGRSLSVDGGSRHAFAVWGHDESDSNASDSDSQA
jgi:NAD+ kinase